MAAKESPLHEGEGQGEGAVLIFMSKWPLIRPSATFSLREKGLAVDLVIISLFISFHQDTGCRRSGRDLILNLYFSVGLLFM